MDKEDATPPISQNHSSHTFAGLSVVRILVLLATSIHYRNNCTNTPYPFFQHCPSEGWSNAAPFTDTCSTGFGCSSAVEGSSGLTWVWLCLAATVFTLSSMFWGADGASGELSVGFGSVDFSEGNFGRDFLSGFFAQWRDSLARLFWDTLLSIRNRADWEALVPFPFGLVAGVLLLRPSFGDLGLVTGICITVKQFIYQSELIQTILTPAERKRQLLMFDNLMTWISAEWTWTVDPLSKIKSKFYFYLQYWWLCQSAARGQNSGIIFNKA